MSEYLRAHPQVFMSFPKEPSYLADDFPELHAVYSMPEYLKLFENSSPDHKIIGEASVWYLYSKSALANIRTLNPAAKVLIMLRHPVSFLESYHSHLQFSQVENEADLEKAWMLQETRAEGANIPHTCRSPMMLQYDNILRFGNHMEEVLSVFPRDQVKCVLFEDFISDPRTVYLETLAFLGLGGDGRSDFPRLNSRKTPRSKLLATLMFSPPPVLRAVWRGAKRVFGSGLIHQANRILLWNSVPLKSTPLSDGFRHHLIETLEEDMVKLEGLIGENLGTWYRKPDEKYATGNTLT